MSDASSDAVAKAAPRRILWVDDDHYFLAEHKFELEWFGLEVVTATTPGEAINHLNSQSFQTILVDMRMDPIGLPDEIETKGGFYSGLVLARHIKKNYPSSRVIVCSVSHAPPDLELSLKAGNLEFLNKGDIPRSGMEFAQMLGVNIEQAKKSFWRRTYDSLELKPRFLGLGIDLKKLFGKRSPD